MAPLVYVITLNWNCCKHTLECLGSIFCLEYSNLRVLVVDNGSIDGTPQAVASEFPQAEIIVNETNLGFAAGCNVGLRRALDRGAEYVFLVNNDTLIHPMALSYLLAQAAPGVGLLAPKIYYASEPNRIWSIGGNRHPLTLEKINDARGQIDAGQWESILEREYLVGCGLLISRRVLEQVGLFDERFFMYYEDADYSLRVSKAGFRLLMVPQAKMWHKVAASSGGSSSPNERYWMARSSVLFFAKHVRGLRWLIVLPYRLGSAIKTLLKLIIQGRHEAARAYGYGLRDGWLDVLAGSD